MITWVLEKASFEHRIAVNEKIIKRLAETGNDHREIFIVPFERSVVGGDPLVEGHVVAYGSTAIDDVVDRNGWKPGVWRTDGTTESEILSKLGSMCLNHDMKILKPTEVSDFVKDQGWEFFFVKPDTDAKEFPGMICDQAKYPFFIEGIVANMWDKHDFNVAVSSLKELGIEWRIPVVDGKIVDYSIYRQWQKVMPSREIYQEVLDFTEKAISLHNPALAYFIDVAQVGKELKVVEYTGFNSAGFYACDVNNIVDAINKMVMKYY